MHNEAGGHALDRSIIETRFASRKSTGARVLRLRVTIGGLRIIQRRFGVLSRAFCLVERRL